MGNAEQSTAAGEIYGEHYKLMHQTMDHAHAHAPAHTHTEDEKQTDGKIRRKAIVDRPTDMRERE